MTPVTVPSVDAARHQDTLARARASENAGDEATAESGFREVLDATRGSGTLVAWVALANLTGLYQRQGRESECLLLIRRLIDGAVDFEPFRGVWARQALCMALANIEDWPRLADELPRFEAAIPGSPAPHLAVFTRSAQALRATIALQCGTVEDARVVHAGLLSALDETAAPNTRRFVHLIGADVELRARRFPEALAAARQARVYASSPIEAIASAVVEAECLLELDGTAAAAEVVREALGRIDAAPPSPRASALLVKAGPRLAGLVADRCGDELLARRTYDLASSAIVRRAVEIERAMVDLPELADPHPADEASLAAFRARFSHEKREFLAAVARVLGDRSGGAAFLRSDHEGLMLVCAWCLRLLRRDGTWQPVGHFLAGADQTRVTHGICEACDAAMRSDASVRAA